VTIIYKLYYFNYTCIFTTAKKERTTVHHAVVLFKINTVERKAAFLNQLKGFYICLFGHFKFIYNRLVS